MQNLPSVVLRGVSLFLLAGPPLGAQAVSVEAPRMSSLVAFGPRADPPGMMFLHYGPATWRPAYLAEARGKTPGRFRLGSGYWATFTHTVGLELGGKKIPANTWYLGLQRVAGGSWSLILMDSTKVMRSGATAGTTRDVKPDVRVSLQVRRDAAPVPELRVRLMASTGENREWNKGTLEIHWHTFAATVPYVAAVRKVAPAGEPKFVAMQPARTETTASGLKIEELRAGVGPSPARQDQVRVRYVMWLADQKVVDSTFPTRRIAEFPVGGVIRGWVEGLQRMKTGGIYRLRIPAKLGYGARGAGTVIPPNADLESWVELVEIVKTK